MSERQNTLNATNGSNYFGGGWNENTEQGGEEGKV